ncbi:E3 ubiquitin-protein ligase MARCH6 [Exophiala viscosa]|uniref:E3 ubiquitin-protein ligase MARCH6 n=1 Tax=Exophiala viscosa TaxID=2486360 RepID=UPI00218DCEAE|nr:E3 ubiquitin-protein ligase MARCH6 [Exophiala viscosa]
MSVNTHERRPSGLRLDKSRPDNQYEEGQDYCRICRGEGSPEQPLYYPCKCSGSIKFVHQECLMEWLSHSQKKYCELCKTSFRFTKLYDRSMPATLPLPLFVRQLARHGFKSLARWIRYTIVALIWVCCLPWCIRQVWRGMIWFADGTWEEMESHLSTDVLASGTSTASIPVRTFAANFTMPEYLERIKLVFPPMQLSLADIARAFLSQGLIGRLLQLILSLFMPLAPSNTEEAISSNMTSTVQTSNRPPSLLSNVHFFGTLSKSPAINGTIIDIVEGQLICVFLVTAFILVFLIREWVINQQPNLNMPDPDLADFAAPEPQAQGAEQPANPPVDADHPTGADAQDLVPGENPDPRLRRVVSDNNILRVRGNGLERADLPVRSQSLEDDRSSTPGLDNDEPALGESNGISDQSLSNSILVERAFGVSSGSDVPERERFPVYFQDSTANGDPEFFTSEHLDRIHAESMETSSSTPAHGHDRRVSFAGDVTMVGEHGSEEPMPPTEDTDSEGVPIPTPDSSESDRATENNEIAASASNATTPADQPASSGTRGLSVWGKVSRWLWNTEGLENIQILAEPRHGPNGDIHHHHDDEHVVQDPFDEAPFVPNHNREALQPLLPEIEAPAPAEARQPNIVLGVDLNDPNAAEDVEDLDGVLELLGMEGPIFGMVQNVIFSLFLITVTLTASVWCPYVWGKIALLFMHNPAMVMKAPLFVLSTGADVVVDVVLFTTGLAGFILNQPLKVVKAIISPVVPAIPRILDTAFLEGLSLDLSQKSGARIEKTLSGALFDLRPDLPVFSMLSHHALLTIKAHIRENLRWTSSAVVGTWDSLSNEPPSFRVVLGLVAEFVKTSRQWPAAAAQLFRSIIEAVRRLPDELTLTPSKPHVSLQVDKSLVEWSIEDRFITIMIGYAFFAAASILCLELAHLVMGLRDNEKVEGYLADCLRQAGGVMKVVVIIGIEMLVFPLYCGLLLDLALLPLFANATVAGRIAFIARAPFTGIFIHWFIGTCYMFHFALFVSICRKIMRAGVLYFIRDPDDPTFHPVRDVLERPVPAQLGKIAFSALVYGALVIVCLGGVVWSLSCVDDVLPIQWATPEPRLAFPVDIVFYNFMLPFVIRKAEPSKKISAIYNWWFRGCAGALRLTDFLFGEKVEEETYSTPHRFWGLFTGKALSSEQQKDGTYVRAPASDSVRIPKGYQVFLEVNEQNERVDGLPDPYFGNHGKKDPRFTKVYLPPNFGARITTFVLLLWLFAASTGVSFTIGPLLLGRKVIQFLSKSALPPNDLYAFTIGIHLSAALGYLIAYARPASKYLKSKIPEWFGSQFIASTRYFFGLAYLGTFTAVVLPLLLSMITELYIHIPLITYLEMGYEKATPKVSPTASERAATIYVLQSWTIGLLYLRLLLRLFMHHAGSTSQVTTALRAITRNGILKPDVPLASRAFVLPAIVVFGAFLVVPLVYAKAIMLVTHIHDHEAQMRLYRLAYPGVLCLLVTWLGFLELQRQVATWRVKVRDEVYLIGERLHNFQESRPLRSGKERAA